MIGRALMWWTPRTGAMLGFKWSKSAATTIASIEIHQSPMLLERLLTLLLATLLTVAILLVFLDGLSARGPQRINRLPEAATRCGFWSEMSAGISCR